MNAEDLTLIRSVRDLALAGATPQGRDNAAQTGAFLADELRRSLPDLDDAAIALVTASAASVIWNLSAAAPDGRTITGSQAASGLALAAADLAHLDLYESP